MATGKITKRTVEAVPVPEKDSGKRAHLWDDTLKGFGVMVTDRGVRSYIIQYRMGGRGTQTRRVTIGKHGSPWTAEKARDRAAELLEQVRRDDDPFDAAKAKLAAERETKRKDEEARAIVSRLAFSTLADTFIDKYAKVNQPKTWKDTDSVVRRDLKPFFLDKALPHIDHDDIVRLLDRVGERGDGAALKAYKALRSFFGWAKERHRKYLPVSPMADMRPPSKTVERERTLTDAELRYVWKAAGGLGWPFGPIVRLLILLGQRRDETAEIAWPEIDKAKRQWLLPGERSKNGKANLVHLSDPAFAIIDDLPVIKSNARLMFTTTGETPVSGFSKIKVRLDKAILALMRDDAKEAGATEDEIEELAVTPWTYHDLRRTLASGCQKLGVKIEVTEAVLNHVSGTRSGIVKVYQTYQYQDEKRDALDLWGRHVMQVVTGKSAASNVVPMGRRA